VEPDVWIGARVPAAPAAPDAVLSRPICHVAQKQRLRKRPLSQTTCNTLRDTVTSNLEILQQEFVRVSRAARMGDKQSAYKVWVGKPEGKISLGRPSINGMAILKRILNWI
jgi:hypothetical protein